MNTPFSRRQILGCSGGAAAGLLACGAAGAQTESRSTKEALINRSDDESGFVRLLFNENPYGPPESAKQAIRAAIDDSWSYGYKDVRSLRSLIAEQEGVRPDNVIITEGSGEILKIAGLVLGGGKEVISARPTFTMLTEYAMRNGAQIRWVDLLKDMNIDLAAMEDRVTEGTGVVYICNPNNPTGLAIDSGELRQFIGAMPQRVTVVVDEAYVEFTDKPRANTVVDLVKSGMNVLVTRTFSKVYGMAGLRIGYGLGRPDIIRRLEQRRISIPNRLGLRAALASYNDEVFLNHSRSMIRAGVDHTCSFFKELGLQYLPTQTNFVLFNAERPATDFYRYMSLRNILVAPRTDHLDTWVRVSIGRMEHMKMFSNSARGFF